MASKKKDKQTIIRVKRRHSVTPPIDPAMALAIATKPLLEFFAAADDVFTEDDALTESKRQMSLGRLYRAWKAARVQLDPTYNTSRDSLVKTDQAREERRQRPKAASLQRDERSVLRTKRH